MYDHGFSLLRYDNETPDGSSVIQIHNHGVSLPRHSLIQYSKPMIIKLLMGVLSYRYTTMVFAAEA